MQAKENTDFVQRLKISKEKEVILRLIKVYEEMPYLWNKSHKDYKNKNCRDEGHKVLLEIIRELEPRATLKSSKKKIENLRTNYIKELKKVIDSQRSSSESVYVPSLYYYNSMQFLNEHTDIDMRKPARERELLEIKDPLSQLSSEEESDCQRPTSIRTRSHTSQTPKIFVQTRANHQMDEQMQYSYMRDEKWEAIGRSIGLQLRDMDKTQRTVAHKLINDVMYYGESGLLSHQCSISIPLNTSQSVQEYEPESRDSKEHLF